MRLFSIFTDLQWGKNRKSRTIFTINCLSRCLILKTGLDKCCRAICGKNRAKFSLRLFRLYAGYEGYRAKDRGKLRGKNVKLCLHI